MKLLNYLFMFVFATIAVFIGNMIWAIFSNKVEEKAMLATQDALDDNASDDDDIVIS